jgi:CHAD domain-containing protein
MKPSPTANADNLQAYVSELILHFASVILNNYELLRAENHAGALHDMRVATRRMRETITLFEPLFLPARVKKSLSSVKKLTKTLGLPREIDVNLKLIGELQPSGGLVARAASEHLKSILTEEQLRLRKRLLRALEKIGLKSLREELTHLAQSATTAPFRPHLLFEEHQSAIRENFLKLIPRILQDRATPVFNFDLNASTLEDDHAIHQLRIVTKKLRYVFEITKPLVSIPCDELARSCRVLQDVIGAQHDTCMLIERIGNHQAELNSRDLTLLADGCRQLLEDLLALKKGFTPQIESAYTNLREKLAKELMQSETSTPEVVPSNTLD